LIIIIITKRATESKHFDGCGDPSYAESVRGLEHRGVPVLALGSNLPASGRAVCIGARDSGGAACAIILLSVAASLNSAVSNPNIRRVSELFSLDIFMKMTLADVDSMVSHLAAYIDTKNTDAVRAYMHEAMILSAEKATGRASCSRPCWHRR
jgi:hypothetical protein